MLPATILLVDDEKMVLDCLKQQLRQSYGGVGVVETAERVSEAWEVISELEADGHRLDVIVSDFLMPGTRGDELLRLVKDRSPSTFRVLLTGQADEGALERCRRHGAAHRIFRKPWSIAELRLAIDAHVA